MRLQDKVIVITGSGSGLGRESALLFASEGATIVTSDVVAGRAQAVAKEVEATGGTASGDEVSSLAAGCAACAGGAASLGAG